MRRLPAIALVAVALASPALAEDVVNQRKLDNGLDVIVVEKTNAPIVTIEIAVKTGAFTETRDTNGLSHLYEHMFFKGNAAIPTQDAFMKRIQELGIRFNGTTGDERVNYFITLPSKSFAAGMRFMADALLSPLFNQEELEKERLVVIGEYDRNEAQNEYYLHRDMSKALWGDDYVRKNPIGVRETILKATRETMIDFKNTYYVPNNSLLTIVGDVNKTEAQSLVDRYFGPAQWKQADDPHQTHPRGPMPRLEASKAVVTLRERVATPTLAATWNGPDTDRDTRATFVADVWGALVGQRSGRFQKTFIDGALATSARLGYGTNREGATIHFNASLLKPAPDVREALLSELRAMVEDPTYFTEDQLKNAKHALQVDRAYEAQSGEALTHSLSFHWASASLDYYRAYLDETSKVSRDEVRDFVKAYLAGKPYVIGCLVAQKGNELDEATLLGTAPEQRGDAAASAVTAFKLENGVRVIARHDPTAGIAALQVFMDGGAAYLTKETQGLERLALQVALEGSKKTPRDAMRQRLEEIGARFTSDINADYSCVGIQAPSGEGFQDAMQLLADCLEEPELSSQALEQRKRQTIHGLKREAESPDLLLRRRMTELFYAGHPYENRVDGTVETVQTFDAAACRKAIAQAMTPDRVVLVFVSPLGTEAVQTIAKGLFGWIKPSSDAPARATLGPVKPTERSAFEKNDRLPTTYIRGQFAMPGPQDPQFASARVLMTILSQRLWEEIRTKRALSYAPNAGVAQTRANFGIVYATSKDAKQTVQVMNTEVAKLKAELVTPSDIRNIVNGDITGKAARSETASNHALSLGRAELLSGGWRRFYDETQDLAKVTPEDVREAAKKYLVDGRWVFVGPEPVDEKLLGGD